MAGSKKELEIYHEYNNPLYKLRFKGGGELPEALKGSFTSVIEAERMRDLYYASKLPKNTTNGKVDKAS